MTVWTTHDSPLGTLLLVGEESATAPGGTALTSVSALGQQGAPAVLAGWRDDPGAFAEAQRQLDAYFAGERDRFELEFTDGTGTEFQRRVWHALEDIPYGTTVTYGEIGERVGAQRAELRAVGAAIGANPLLVVRPCHRVIAADGGMRGFAAGVERKVELLTHEGALQPALGAHL